MASSADSTYRVVLLEDEPEQHRYVVELMGRYPKRELFSLATFTDIASFEAYLEKGGTVDVFLCDISLTAVADDACDSAPSENSLGIDFVRRHFADNADVQVIYISGYTQFCSEVYSTHHAWFLIKPVSQNDFDRALDKALDNLEEKKNKPMGFVVDGDIVLVRPKSIKYVESHLRKVRIHTDEGSFETYSTLSKIEERMPRSFIRCHGSFLVNMDHAARLEKDQVVLLSGEKVSVSQRHRRHVKDAFASYLLNA